MLSKRIYPGTLADVNSQLGQIVTKTSCDFLYSSPQQEEWFGAGVNSGTLSYDNGSEKHPGICLYLASASANSGYRFLTNTSAILLSGGEKTTFIFKQPSLMTNITRRMGFHDSASEAVATDGVYIKIFGNVLSGQCVSNTNVSTTGTTFTITGETWYRGTIELNATATLATFTVYQDNSDNVLWTSTIATNIPVGAGRYVGHIDNATHSAGSAGAALAYIDYIDIVWGLGARKVL